MSVLRNFSLRKVAGSLRLDRRVAEMRAAKPPSAGYAPAAVACPALDRLTDEQLAELNSLMKWNCFTVDGQGRRFGGRARVGKRQTPQSIPDERIIALHRAFGLSDKTVLELGCFEGVHTTGLCQFAKHVTAVDCRVENVVKTMVRCGFYGASPRVFLSDVDSHPLDPNLPEVDVCFHCGVLYHLADPVSHLRQLLNRVRVGLLLDTHYAREEEATECYTLDARQYRYKRYGEGGKRDVFSGAYDHAKWLRLEDLLELLNQAGFRRHLEVQPREERNGSRVMIIASREGAG